MGSMVKVEFIFRLCLHSSNQATMMAIIYQDVPQRPELMCGADALWCRLQANEFGRDAVVPSAAWSLGSGLRSADVAIDRVPYIPSARPVSRSGEATSCSIGQADKRGGVVWTPSSGSASRTTLPVSTGPNRPARRPPIRLAGHPSAQLTRELGFPLPQALYKEGQLCL